MISFVANLINFIALTIQHLLFATSLIGKLIVVVITETSYVVLFFLKNLFKFLGMVYEDNVSTFTEDFPNLLCCVVDTIIEHCIFVQTTIHNLLNEVYHNIISAVSSVKWTIDQVYIIVCEVFLLLKETVSLIGQSLWFMITFIPLELCVLFKTSFVCVYTIILDSITKAYINLLKFTNFLTDVPLESFVGITLTILIIRLYITFSDSIHAQLSAAYWSFMRKILYLYYLLYNYFTDSEVRVITRMVGHHIISRENNSELSIIDQTSDADTLCVICKERQKCVLTLPCRHVCLCTECCLRLYAYQRTCPICRTFIYQSLNIYL